MLNAALCSSPDHVYLYLEKKSASSLCLYPNAFLTEAHEDTYSAVGAYPNRVLDDIPNAAQ